MHSFSFRVARLLAICLLLFGAIATVGAQEDGAPFPQPTAGFKPKFDYEMDIARAWGVVTAAMNEQAIPVDAALKDANQITTAYRMGPSEGGGLFSGKLLTQYRFVVTFSPISSSQTRIKVNAYLQARRLAATLGKVMSGNNALSDVSWMDATSENPDQVAALQDWLYEKIEQKQAALLPATGAAISAAPISPTSRVAAPGSPQGLPQSGIADSLEKELDRLKALRRRNVITEAEYKSLRAKVLGL